MSASLPQSCDRKSNLGFELEQVMNTLELSQSHKKGLTKDKSQDSLTHSHKRMCYRHTKLELQLEKSQGCSLQATVP